MSGELIAIMAVGVTLVGADPGQQLWAPEGQI